MQLLLLLSLVLLCGLHLTLSSRHSCTNCHNFSLALYFIQASGATQICWITEALAICQYCHIINNICLMLESYDCVNVNLDLDCSPE